ncbi:hypothetical protein [Sphingobacterium arenae]|uniref:Paeninodin family lasso peptide n=1 Tax=Sphingobacterium arenae TaxID=1280598 RepID=A0ABR7Y7U6_9SPHI|nr:hypothetical protein [Sphingobacterium arenae]MBD1427332.1 hypothetical protein [Sphingobacterium arenae]
MKTIKKMKYVSPALEVVQIEMEEGIAGGSPGAVAPGTTPGSNDWGEGTPGGGNWDGN